MTRISDEKIEQLRKEHAHVHHLTCRLPEGGDADVYEVVCKRPNRAEFKRFLSERGKCQGDVQRADEVLEAFLRRHLLLPDKLEFDAMLDERPGLLETFASKLLDLCGAGAEVEAKKL